MMSDVSAGDPLGLGGQILHEQFRVDELADDSARAFLYRGAHVGSEIPVALKFLKVPNGADAEAFVRRFRHESRLHYAVAQATPHVTRLLASGSTVPKTTGLLTPFNVLEWLHGQSLAADFAERRAHWEKGRSVDETIALLDPAAEALSVAHAHNVIHREVTPTNLFVVSLGDQKSIKLLDFGLAKISESVLGENAQTVDLGPLAAPIYAAPEQFSRDAGSVGPSTDLYSLMMIFLEALRDRPVMDESRAPLAARVLDPKNRPTPRSLGIVVGENLELVIAEAVAVSSSQRPQNLGEFWANLKRAALKDARKASISSAPSLHARGIDAGPEDDETEVQINLSFLRPSRIETVPHPEPATVSRPFDDNEPVSSFGEMFEIVSTTRDPAPTPKRPAPPPNAQTMLSPGQTHPDDIATAVNLRRNDVETPEELKATLVSTGPRATELSTTATLQQASSATPFALARREDTAVIPFVTTTSNAAGVPPPPMPERPVMSQPPAPMPFGSMPPPAGAQPMRAPPSPWLTMLIVFVVCVAVLTLIAAWILR